MKINQPNPVNFLIQKLNIGKKSGVVRAENNLNTSINNINELTRWENSDINSVNKGPKWDLKKVPLKYYIEKDIFAEKLVSNFSVSVDKAFNTWSSASGGLVRFEKSLLKDRADIIVNWINETFPGRDYEAGRNDLKVVNNKIEKAEIKIMVFPLIDAGLTDDKRIERVRRTALHEVGHALGLKHSSNPKDIMFHRGISNKNLSNADKQRLVDFYKSDGLNIIS